MRTRVFYFLSVLLFFGCMAHRNLNYDKPRKLPKQQLVPPGTVWLRDSTFIDITEVRNLDYLEFLYLNRDSVEYYHKLLPDSMCWYKTAPDTLAPMYMLYYLRHPGFRDYPVVAVSYWQAMEFCKWRSLSVNRYLYIKSHGGWDKFPPEEYRKLNPPQYVEYRLPSREQWEFASAAGLEYEKYPLGYENVLNKDNLLVSNTGELKNITMFTRRVATRINHKKYVFDYFTQSVYYGKQNRYGIYNLLGNVSEIIADSAFKGLSYESTLDGNAFAAKPDLYQKIDSTKLPYDYKYTFKYTGPHAWLGFRCVCVVKQIPE